MEYSVLINGLEVSAQYTEKSIQEIFVPMLHYLSKLQKEKKRRIIVLLAAPPGAGKSTLVDFLQRLSRDDASLTGITSVGMDGFHCYQEELLSKTTVRNGQEVSLVEIKGHPMTFDLPRLKMFLEKTASGEDCWWPIYDRTKHNPQGNAVFIQGNIVLVEGNYLLLDTEGWRDLQKLADVTIRIDAEPSKLRKRLVERKAASGNANAEKFVDFSDMVNVELCLQHSLPADIELMLNADDSYSLIRKNSDF